MCQRLLGVGTKFFLRYIVILHRKAMPMGSTHCKHSLTLYLWIRKPRLLPPIIGVRGPSRELPVTLEWIWSNSSSVISEYRSNSSLSPDSLRLRWMVETLTYSISAVFCREEKWAQVFELVPRDVMTFPSRSKLRCCYWRGVSSALIKIFSLFSALCLSWQHLSHLSHKFV